MKSSATILAAIALAAPVPAAAAQTSCKFSLLGVCTSYYTPEEQAGIDARAASDVVQRLRKQVHFDNGTILVNDGVSITAFPATVAWSTDCLDTSVWVNFGSDTTVEVTPKNISLDEHTCNNISRVLGAALLRLTRGE
jgi:hypothetical protein